MFAYFYNAFLSNLDESMVFRVAHAYEQSTPWHERHPDIDASIARTDDTRRPG